MRPVGINHLRGDATPGGHRHVPYSPQCTRPSPPTGRPPQVCVSPPGTAQFGSSRIGLFYTRLSKLTALFRFTRAHAQMDRGPVLQIPPPHENGRCRWKYTAKRWERSMGESFRHTPHPPTHNVRTAWMMGDTEEDKTKRTALGVRL